MTAYPSENPKLQKSIVCYVDILGFSQLSSEALEKNEGNAFLIKLRNALSKAYEDIRKRANGWGENEYFTIKIFTDNIVVGYPLQRFNDNFGESELGDIFSVFRTFQMNLALEGFLARGGIAVGELFMDNDIVFGDALLKAVAQDKNGGPPYISLSPSAVKILQAHLGFYVNTDFAPQCYHLLEDSDGTIFINYLQEAFIAFPDAGIFFKCFEGHKKTIIRGLKKYSSHPGIRSKYEWAARYHNYVCNDMAEKYSNFNYNDGNFDELDALAAEEAQRLLDYTIDIESLTGKPRKLTIKPLEKSDTQAGG